MQRRRLVTAMIVPVLSFLITGNILSDNKARGRTMGYCFDAAFDGRTNRLYVAGGQAGTHVFKVADGTLDFVTTVSDGGYHRNLKIAGDRIYLADTDRGLVVYDITGEAPARKWIQQDAKAMGVCVHGKHVYLAVGAQGLQVFDITTPDDPKLIGQCRTNADAWDVWVSGDYAYVADLTKGLTVVDISRPSQPRKVSWVTWDQEEPMAEIVRGEGHLVYVAAGKHGLIVIDVSHPETPRVVSRYTSGTGGFGEGLYVRDGLVYLANGNNDSAEENGLIILDARRPESLAVKGKCTFRGWVEGVCVAGHQAFVTNTYAGVRSIDVSDPDRPRLTDSFGPARASKATPLPIPKASPQKRETIEYLQRAKQEILEGRKFNDLSTVGGAFLTYISALRHEDEALLLHVSPVFAEFKISPGDLSELCDHLVRPAIIRRIEVASERPQESDLCSIYTSNAPNRDIGQIWTFGFVNGAWRFLNCTVTTDPWETMARKMESQTRDALKKGPQERRGRYAQDGISEEVAVVTGTPLTAEILDWDISLRTDLPDNRLEIQAACTIRHTGPASLDHLDFDLLAAERFYGLHVEIAKITGLVDGREVNLSFTRDTEQPPSDPNEAGTHECPLVTRVTLPSALKPGQACRLVFDYAVMCPDITRKHHYNPIWEPEEGKKEVCLIADFTWFPSLVVDLQKLIALSGKKNFFLRGSKPAWRVTLTHPAQLEGMVIDGRLEKTTRTGQETVSQWKSIVGGRPQVFIGAADRIEKKGEKATVVFLLPKEKYNREFVDAVADLLLEAYSAYTDWFGPMAGNEVHIVSPAGIRGGHGAFLGMTIEASYFQRSKDDVIKKFGAFFVETPVHELAHSWWPESYGRGTKFLRESLANFATWHLAREHYGKDLFAFSLRKGIFERSRGGKPLFNAESDDEGFAYVKGPLVLDILRREMDDDVFFRTIKEYVRRYRDGHATLVDFVSVCNAVSQRDWMPFFYHWCYEKGYPGYQLVGFESKEGKRGWETTVTIRNSGAGIVRCPLQLQMADGVREELFAIQGGRERTFLYLTAQKVTAVVIDPEQTVYQQDLAEKRKSPAYLVRSAGYGRASNQELVSRYDETWLEQLDDAGLLLKVGFALYDAKRYDEALAIFERMEKKVGGNQLYVSMALIWQGHMLDLLGRHKDAIPRYERVAAMGLNKNDIHHDQFGIVYKPSPYARQRIDTPFTRVENTDQN